MKGYKIVKQALFVLFLGVIASCGGGSGGDSDPDFADDPELY